MGIKLRQKKELKDHAQPRQRKRDDNGNIVIDMTVKNDDDFLSVYSGGEATVISSDVADFIENSTRSLSPREKYTLIIHSVVLMIKKKMNTTRRSKNIMPRNILQIEKNFV